MGLVHFGRSPYCVIGFGVVGGGNMSKPLLLVVVSFVGVPLVGGVGELLVFGVLAFLAKVVQLFPLV